MPALSSFRQLLTSTVGLLLLLLLLCFSRYEMGPGIVGTMERFMYRDISRDHLLPYTAEIMPLRHQF